LFRPNSPLTTTTTTKWGHIDLMRSVLLNTRHPSHGTRRVLCWLQSFPKLRQPNTAPPATHPAPRHWLHGCTAATEMDVWTAAHDTSETRSVGTMHSHPSQTRSVVTEKHSSCSSNLVVVVLAVVVVIECRNDVYSFEILQNLHISIVSPTCRNLHHS